MHQPLRLSYEPIPEKICIVWCKARVPLYQKLSLNIIRETCSYLPTKQLLVAVLSDHMSFFDIGFRTWKTVQLHKRLEVNDTSVSVLVDEDVFTCGGGLPPCTCHIGKRVYILQQDGTVLPQKDLHWERLWPGVVYHPGRLAVYVFGGCDSGDLHTAGETNLITSEMWLKASSQWQTLPDMIRPRGCFTPCIYSDFIYLSGGVGKTALDKFDPRSNLYEELLIGTKISGPSASAVIENSLVLVTCKEVAVWSFAEKRFVRRTSLSEEISVWSNCTPVIGAGKIHIINLADERCFSVGLMNNADSISLTIP